MSKAAGCLILGQDPSAEFCRPLPTSVTVRFPVVGLHKFPCGPCRVKPEYGSCEANHNAGKRVLDATFGLSQPEKPEILGRPLSVVLHQPWGTAMGLAGSHYSYLSNAACFGLCASPSHKDASTSLPCTKTLSVVACP